ncbi:MerR family transcriptional regulator [Brevibacterium spongiae]|uniref:MerR family transcriptional regulator n=1 Tax=Brevibacterium spongiae TaxID=2909672 RepID=A0ABY5SKF1_9MICO|nr:MerR family transcriptional regulator [Brevibacterium spongiae]UVI35018.1 MerR family transcriptional regulator [Brevibacterium spongiae]
MAELSRRSELRVPTIKYYLREGLLPPGRRTSVNQAVYDQTHLDRLRLIRALTSVAGLPLAKVRAVIDAVNGQASEIDAMAVTQDTLIGNVGTDIEVETEDTESAALLDQAITARGWRCETSSPAYKAAVNAVALLSTEELTPILDRLDAYVEAAERVGRNDLEAIGDADSLEERIRGVVLGSLLRRPLLEALVLLAQQHFAQNLNRVEES